MSTLSCNVPLNLLISSSYSIPVKLGWFLNHSASWSLLMSLENDNGCARCTSIWGTGTDTPEWSVFTRIRLATDHYSTMIVLLTHRILKVTITSDRYVKQSEFVSTTNSLDSSALPTWISPQSNRAWSASNKFVRETSIAYYGTCYLGEAPDQLSLYITSRARVGMVL